MLDSWCYASTREIDLQKKIAGKNQEHACRLGVLCLLGSKVASKVLFYHAPQLLLFGTLKNTKTALKLYVENFPCREWFGVCSSLMFILRIMYQLYVHI